MKRKRRFRPSGSDTLPECPAFTAECILTEVETYRARQTPEGPVMEVIHHDLVTGIRTRREIRRAGTGKPATSLESTSFGGFSGGGALDG